MSEAPATGFVSSFCVGGGVLAATKPGMASLGETCRNPQRVGLRPELVRDPGRLDPGSRPPIHFLAGAVQFAMMRPAQRHRELVTDLLCQTAGLREPQMMRIAGLASADQAGLLGDEPEMDLVAQRDAAAEWRAGSCRCGRAIVGIGLLCCALLALPSGASRRC